MKKILVGILLTLVLVLLPAPTVSADTDDDIAVTATPAYVDISVSPDTYDIGGAGAKILPATTYYANPLGETTPPSATVLATECALTITNTSTITTDITVNFPHFTSGDAMQNSGGGFEDAEAGEFGCSGYVTGMTWDAGAVILDNAGSGFLVEDLGATTDIKFGWALLTQSDAWASGTPMTSTVNVAATPA